MFLFKILAIPKNASPENVTIRNIWLFFIVVITNDARYLISLSSFLLYVFGIHLFSLDNSIHDCF
jgi:hypothetical protein